MGETSGVTNNKLDAKDYFLSIYNTLNRKKPLFWTLLFINTAKLIVSSFVESHFSFCSDLIPSPSDTQLYELNYEGLLNVTYKTPPDQQSLNFLMIEVQKSVNTLWLGLMNDVYLSLG